MQKRTTRLALIVGRLLVVVAGFGLLLREVPTIGAGTNTALQFNGSSQYVTFGATPSLGAATFTLEVWFKRTAAGATTSTGTGGVTAVPLVTKGRGEAENSNRDMNYFLGINSTTNRLVADFEEANTGLAGNTPGLNHPIEGTTVITSNTWHHAAATYDGQTWRLYLDGVADGSLAVGQPPRSDSIQHAAIATAMNSTGVAEGGFAGVIDDVRIWNVARTASQIVESAGKEFTSASGLIAHWSFSENTGTNIGDSSGNNVTGTSIGTPSWVGATDISAPPAPANVTADTGNQRITLGWTRPDLDVAGYNVYRSLTSPVSTSGSPLNGTALLILPTYTDSPLTNLTRYYYAVAAVDRWGNATSTEISNIPDAGAGGSLSFDGTNDYVTFGPAPQLGAVTFTLETWFKRTGFGIGNTTGGGGIASAIPLLTKGRNEAEASNVDMNYFLGIDATSGVLVADFEEGAGGPSPGLNHPVSGTTAIPIANIWHHAAATYDGRTWKLYLDGNLDKTLDLGSAIPPRSDSIQHAALGTGLNSTGVSAGLFQGFIDEARIWNFARSQAQIQGTMNQEVPIGLGLIGRWDLNEGAGTAVADSALGSSPGTLTSGPTWAGGHLFDTTVNQPPVADAGPDITVTYPASASLTGSVTDDGLPTPSMLTSAWSKVSGPGTVTFGSASSPTTTASFSVSGVYVLRLTTNDTLLVTTDDVTVVANQKPTVQAGIDQTITFPSAATLSGTVADDGLPAPAALSVSWSQVSGPGTVLFANQNSASTNASFSAAGIYVLRLTGNDGFAQNSDDVTITVDAPANQPPVVNAGSDQTIALPAGAPLVGSVTDDGLPGPAVTVTWSKVSGPGSVAFLDASTATTTASFSTAGVYVLRLTGSDGVLAGSDDITITVNPVPGNYALDFAGTNAYVTFGPTAALGLPTFTIEAKFRRDGTGVGTSTGTGGIASAVPLVTKGRAQAEDSNVDMNYFLGINSATNHLVADFEEAHTGQPGNNPGLNHPIEGATTLQNGVWYHVAATYDGVTWRLFVNGALDVQLTVGQPPRSDSIQHAAIGSALTSTGAADGFFDGVIDEVRIWNRAETQAEIRANANQELTSGTGLVARWGLNAGIGTLVVNSTSTSNIDGTLTGSGANWASGAPLVNLVPIANAGLDQSVTLPASATLTGAVSDDDLPSPASLTNTWSKVSGPGTVSFSPVDSPVTSASFTAAGTYTLRLTATDSVFAVSDDVTVTVAAPPNQAPVVNAGNDQTVTLPAGAALSGVVTDDGVPGPFSVAWSKVSGPGSVTFGNAAAASTAASFSSPGAYVLRLAANDGLLSASDDLTVTVNPQPGNYALDFDGSDAYVTFGPAQALGLPIFTVEAKFRRSGPGVGTNTGSGGVASAVPLVTKGRAETEDSNVDMNYFLGINSATNRLVADFEEAHTGLTGNTPGLNHPIEGTTTLQDNVWYHAAATYDGITWRLYLNGVLEVESAVGQPPRSDSIQHAAIGSAMNSTGVAAGFFDGVIDEVRIWNRARSQSEVRAALNQALESGSGLVARWGLDEGIGTSANDSLGTIPAGIITGSAWNWTSGAPAINLAPAVDAGADQPVTLPNTAALNGTVSDDGLPTSPGFTTATWSMISGPAPVTFANANAASTTATFSAVGTYVLQLSANDGALASSDNVTITVTGNQAPTVNAGASHSITLPAAALLNGSASDDGLPAPAVLSIAWSKVSGPGVVTFDEPTSPVTAVSFSAAGVYVLRLTANDGELTSQSDTTISVNAAGGSTNQGIGLGGTNAYVTFGNPVKLHLSTFTIEAWFNRQGTGVGTNTGTSGLSPVLPLVTRGMAETETTATDMNYFLGIDMSTNVLAADFEEGAAGTTPGLNHPVKGATAITNNTWHHAAATYDGTKWQLFLDGVLEAQLTVGQPPAAAGNQHFAVGTALNSTGGVGSQTQGFFDGVIDEVRVWNRALSAVEVAENANSEIIAASGLVARWGMNDGAGTSALDSVSPPASGTIVGADWTWAGGAPFNLNHAPGVPVVVEPANVSTGVGSPASLKVTVSDPDPGNLTVTYWGRPKTGSAAGPDFTLVALPDTQFYTSSLNGGSPAIFDSQTSWIVQNLASRNIVFVTQLGDCVQNGDNGGNPIEWVNANNAMSRIEDPLTTLLTHGIPYGIAVGNHDQSPTGDPNGTTTFYNQYFGASRFTGRSYYGGHYGSNNDNHYELFSASGLDFIIIHLEYDPAANPAVLAWANGLIQTYSNRRAIVVSHYIINAGNPGTFGAQGQSIYDTLKVNSNLFMMLSGHVSPPEGQRQDTFNGNTVTTLMSDYQSRANGGSGWLRLMEFSPANNQIRVKTYSPWLNQFETDADSQFTIDYNMSGSGAPFSVIATSTGVAPGSTATGTWSSLASNTEYEWYVTVSDGIKTTTSPTWTFTTTNTNQPPVANSRTATTAEDTATAITLTASDVDSTIVSYSVASQPAHGSVTGNAPNVIYTPAANYNGADSFTFTASDGIATSAPATVSVTITAVNDAPVADPQSVTATEDSPKSITLTAVDVDGNSLTYTVVATPTHGVLSGSGNSRIYTPTANYTGPDSFTFRVSDGTVNSNVATVSIAVSPVNDAPVASNQSVTTAADTPKALVLTGNDLDGDPLTFAVVVAPFNGVLTGTPPNLTYSPASDYTGADAFTFRANDGTADSNVATVTISVVTSPVAQAQSVSTPEDTARAIVLTSTNPNGGTLTFAIATQPTHGTISGTAPNVTYTPAANYTGGDVFTFRSSDGISSSAPANISINVTSVNDAPVADDATYTTPKNRPVQRNLTATDVEGQPLTFSLVSQGRKGTATITNSTTGAFTYAPSSSANGSDTFTFRATDGTLQSNTATVTIKFTSAVSNAAPVATNSSITTTEDVATQGVLSATDSNGDPLTYRIVTNPAKGTITNLDASTGAFGYVPAANANGTDSFTFRANDGSVDSNIATIAVSIAATNDAPVANADSSSVPTDRSVLISVLANDTDADQDALSIASFTQPSHGSSAVEGLSVRYTPAGGYTGTDTFTYVAKDPSGATSGTATVQVNVTAMNQPPVALEQTIITAEDVPKGVTLSASDSNGDALTFVVVTPPAHGTLTGTAPNLTYAPAANYNGSDSFAFRASDGVGDSNVATVTISITAVNDAPIAADSTLTATRSAATAGTFGGSDVDGDPLTFSIVAPPKKGNVTLGPGNQFVYTSNPGAKGGDSFTFRANDAKVDSNVARVTITIK